MSDTKPTVLTGHSVAPGWQPIETAPKDGTTWVLLSRRGGVRARIGAWDSELGRWTVEGSIAPDYQPTHWMVLPSPINIRAVR